MYFISHMRNLIPTFYIFYNLFAIQHDTFACNFFIVFLDPIWYKLFCCKCKEPVIVIIDDQGIRQPFWCIIKGCIEFHACIYLYILLVIKFYRIEFKIEFNSSLFFRYVISLLSAVYIKRL